MGRGLPVCQEMREKIIEMLKNNVPQRKIGRDLDISPSTVRNIIKRFKESGGISSTTIRTYIHKCQLKLYCAKRKPYVNCVQKHRRLLWALRHLGWTITQWKRVRQIHIPCLFLEEMDAVCSGPKMYRPIQTVTSNKSKSHVMVWGCVSALGKGNLHFCDGTINAEKYI